MRQSIHETTEEVALAATPRRLSRREFLLRAGGVGLAAALSALLGKLGLRQWKIAGVSPPRKRRPGRVLTEHEFATLEALADIIVPSDELGPGAADVDAARRLEDRLMRDSRMLTRYREGLRWLDEAASQVYGRGTLFVNLKRDEQVALLQEIERVSRELRRPPTDLLDRAWRYWDKLVTNLFGLGAGVFFFDLVRDDVLETVYAHPRMWALLGYDGPPQPLGYWNGARGDWNIIDDCPPTKRHDFPPGDSAHAPRDARPIPHRGGVTHA